MPGAPVRLAVLGAGAIGRRHIEHIRNEPRAALTAIVDPAPEAQNFANQQAVNWYPTFAAMLAHERPDGIIAATPTQLHVENGLAALSARLPALIEKPLADDVATAAILVAQFEAAGVPLLVGHHRRHNPLIQQAKHTIESGRLGQVVAVNALCWFHKPDSYFDIPWRRAKGAGPILTNLIHDIDLLRYMCGDITQVHAMQSNALRGHAVEETAIILLKFASGVLGTVTVSDKIAAPWSWEFTSGENPAYTHTQESCYHIGGTQASLTIPQLTLWRHPTNPDWSTPITHQRLPTTLEDPLALQIKNFCEVIRGTAPPVVTGRDGLNTLKVIAAIKLAAETNNAVDVE